MPDVQLWRRDDSQVVLACAAEHLRAGRVVALPTEAGYEAVASALHSAAVDALAGLAAADEPLTLVLGEALEIFDWLPALRGAGLRLMRSFWPGPLTMIGSAGAAQGLARHLPGAVRSQLLQSKPAAEALALRCPDHYWPGALRRLVAGPLVAAPLPGWPREVGQIEQGREQLALIVDAGPSPLAAPATLVQLETNSAAMVREGAVPRGAIDAATPCSIVFVCTGNTCRSPLAEGLCRKLLCDKFACESADLEQRGYRVASAGIAAGPGNSATMEAVVIAQTYGVDLAAHGSRPLSIDLLSRADLVFTMTWSHLSLLQSLRVPVGPMPQLLSPAGMDVDDPIGCAEEIYRSCAAQIWQHLNERLPQLLES